MTFIGVNTFSTAGVFCRPAHVVLLCWRLPRQCCSFGRASAQRRWLVFCLGFHHEALCPIWRTVHHRLPSAVSQPRPRSGQSRRSLVGAVLGTESNTVVSPQTLRKVIFLCLANPLSACRAGAAASARHAGMRRRHDAEPSARAGRRCGYAGKAWRRSAEDSPVSTQTGTGPAGVNSRCRAVSEIQSAGSCLTKCRGPRLHMPPLLK